MSFWYLATPYSKQPDGPEAAAKYAALAAAHLIKAGVYVYSPIAHSHPIATDGGIALDSYDVWLPLDEQFMKASCGMILVTMPGWEESKGIKGELEWYKNQGKPILIMNWPL